MQKAYQSIVYNRAVELFDNREFSKAIKNFELVKKHPIDQRLKRYRVSSGLQNQIIS